MLKRSCLSTVVVILLSACADNPLDSSLQINPSLVSSPACSAPALLIGIPDSGIEDQYIVVFHGGTDSQEVTKRLSNLHGFAPLHVYHDMGFAAKLSKEQVAGIRCAPEVKYVEHDRVLTAS